MRPIFLSKRLRKSVCQVKETAKQIRVILEPVGSLEDTCLPVKYVPNEVWERYNSSKCLINPSKYRFHTVVRIKGLVLLFIQKLNSRCKKNQSSSVFKRQYFSHNK